MSRKDAVMIASRALAVYFFWWALDAASYLPERIFSFSHHAGDVSVLAGAGYFRNLYLISLITEVVRSLVLLTVAFWLYRSGSAVSTFLLPADGEQSKG